MEKRFCSFCEKERADVRRMIIGTYGHICNECVVKFYAEMGGSPPPNPQFAALGESLPKEK